MFQNAVEFNQDIGSWDVRKVNNLKSTFDGALAFNGNIGDWDVSSAERMMALFQNAPAFNQDIGSWDVRKVGTAHPKIADNEFGGNFHRTFEGAYAFAAVDISRWDISGITYDDGSGFDRMFGTQQGKKGCVINQTDETSCQPPDTAKGPLSDCTRAKLHQQWNRFPLWRKVQRYAFFKDTSCAISQSTIKQAVADWVQDPVAAKARVGLGIGDWDTSTVTSMDGLFQGLADFNADLSRWDTRNVVSMRSMFAGATSFNSAVAGWEVDKVTDASNAFKGASSFSQNLTLWRLSSARTVALMFDGADAFVADQQAVVRAWKLSNGMQSTTDLHRIVDLAVSPAWKARLGRLAGLGLVCGSGAATDVDNGPCVYDAGATYEKHLLEETGFNTSGVFTSLGNPGITFKVRVVSRSILPPWGSIRCRLALRTYDAPPWGVRAGSQTKSN